MVAGKKKQTFDAAMQSLQGRCRRSDQSSQGGFAKLKHPFGETLWQLAVLQEKVIIEAHAK